MFHNFCIVIFFVCVEVAFSNFSINFTKSNFAILYKICYSFPVFDVFFWLNHKCAKACFPNNFVTTWCMFVWASICPCVRVCALLLLCPSLLHPFSRKMKLLHSNTEFISLVHTSNQWWRSPQTARMYYNKDMIPSSFDGANGLDQLLHCEGGESGFLYPSIALLLLGVQ